MWEITHFLEISANAVPKNVIFIGRLVQYSEPKL